MIIHEATEFHPAIGQTIIGLDLGTKTIGVAISDRTHSIATPMVIIKRKKFTADAAELAKIIAENDVGAIVLGWPIHMDGSEGPRTQSTLAFARNLQRIWTTTAPPILLWDERLSTVEAERAMIQADLSRKKRAAKIDALAASVILQGALDRLERIRNG